MGVVYRARQVSLDRIVALKMILSGTLATPEERARFRREAELAGKLDHPNIVPIHEVREQDGVLFFSMKLIDGGNLAQERSAYLREPAGHGPADCHAGSRTSLRTRQGLLPLRPEAVEHPDRSATASRRSPISAWRGGPPKTAR